MICELCRRRHPYEPSLQRQATKRFDIGGASVMLCRGCAFEFADLAVLLESANAGIRVEVEEKSR